MATTRRSGFRRRWGSVALGAAMGCSVVVAAAGPAGASEFTREADAVCVELSSAITDYEREHGAPASTEDVVAGLEARMPLHREALERLQAIKPPKAARASYREFLDIKEQRLGLNERYIEAVNTGDQATAEEVRAENNDLDASENAAAEDAGLFACAERLTPKAEKRIRAFVEDTWTQGDPAFCTERYTQEYVEAFFASLEECEANESDPEAVADSIDITHVEGVERSRVEVHFTVSGGVDDGQSFVERLVYEDGQYKRQAIFLA